MRLKPLKFLQYDIDLWFCQSDSKLDSRNKLHHEADWAFKAMVKEKIVNEPMKNMSRVKIWADFSPMGCDIKYENYG
ncbi:MAG TPA: hypothetical protein V6C65_11495 [Allocoleopsis sp.]